MPDTETTVVAPGIEGHTPLISRAMAIGLVGIGLLIAAMLGWAVFGQAPDTISGRGLILPSQGFVEVGTRTSYVVDTVDVEPGARVLPGDPVAAVTDESGTLSEVTSPVAGIVIEVRARPGRISERGEPLILIEPTDARPLVRAFLPATEADVIEPGMRALVSPGGSPSAQFGFIEGQVERVSPAPVSPERLATLLGDNDSLIGFLLDSGPVLEVTIQLQPADTFTGYDWTIGDGPRRMIDSSTLVDVTVIVRERNVAAWMVR